MACLNNHKLAKFPAHLDSGRDAPRRRRPTISVAAGALETTCDVTHNRHLLTYITHAYDTDVQTHAVCASIGD